MKLESFFSLKDYFNYYISGLVWCISFLFLAKDTLLRLKDFLTTTSIEAGGVVILGVILLFIPYVVGFTLMPLSNWFVKFWQGKNRSRRPEPRKYVLMIGDMTNRESKRFEGWRISGKETKQIIETAKQIFGFEYNRDFHLYFYPIRAYVLEHGGATAQQAERGRDLQTFAQSLLLPVPLAVITFSIFRYWENWLPLVSGAILAIILHRILVSRYFEMEFYWVKHVYRSFLVITSKKNA
jgi:hypothetical protein